jgi:hypothetical protein
MLVFIMAKTSERAEELGLVAQTVDTDDRSLNLFWFASEHAWQI